MNKKVFVPSVIAIIVIIVIFVVPLMINQIDSSEPEKLSISYVQTNKDLKDSLLAKNISMSSPLRLSGSAIEKYCTFFSNDSLQNSIEYCTSTELLGSDEQYIGNIHMVGTADNPMFVIGVIQVSPTMSNLDDAKIVYQTMIETLVCNCWEEQMPGQFESVSEWIDAAKIHHLGAEKTTSKSEITGLAQKGLLLEITTNTEGYLWKIIIPN